MKKIACTLALMATLFSCNNNQETTTAENTGTSSALSNEIPGEENIENIEDLAGKPLNKGAEKFKGEFERTDVNGVKTLIREHPEKPGLLAVTTSFGDREPITVSYWYDESTDMLSNKQIKGQPKYYTIKLDPTGQTIVSVRYDWNRNETDTTVFKRIR